jgi:hypothetical protein
MNSVIVSINTFLPGRGNSAEPTSGIPEVGSTRGIENDHKTTKKSASYRMQDVRH